MLVVLGNVSDAATEIRKSHGLACWLRFDV